MAGPRQEVAREALPIDGLVLLVGPAGSGKSTWAARHYQPEALLSSDRFRALVAGDEADQAASGDAFRVLHLVADGRLRRGLLSVIDATNLSANARRTLLRLAERHGCPASAVVFDISLERCLRQNASRPGRRVPEPVVRRHIEELRVAVARLPDEGYVHIRTLQDADMEFE